MENRFEVSTAGMKELHAGRPLWSLVKELVSNVWDEESTICKVTVRPSNNGNITKPIECIDITVEDNAGGFKDVDDAYTLMAPTAKRTNSNVRGRFNIGEKEIISVAVRAEVETVGTTVYFPEGGGRELTSNDRTNGTVIRVRVERPHDEVQETIDALSGFLPPAEITYTINGEEPERRSFIERTRGSIPTIVAGGVGEPLRNLWRTTDIDIYQPRFGKGGHIYEMGITIQPIDAPYDVDIQQKVPMPPNRDTVTASYLQHDYSEVLQVVAPVLEQSQASETWVQAAVEDSKTPDETVAKVMEAKLGKKAVLWSSDTQANENAHLAGMEIIHPRTLSKRERERYTGLGENLTPLVSAKEGFGLKTEGMELVLVEETDVTPAMERVAQYTQWLSERLLGFECNVRFISMKAVADKRAAQYGGRTLDFVSDRLGKDWFKMDTVWSEAENGHVKVPMPHQTELILHELAHEGGSVTPHTGEYVHRIAVLGAKATHLALNPQMGHSGRDTWWSTPLR